MELAAVAETISVYGGIANVLGRDKPGTAKKSAIGDNCVRRCSAEGEVCTVCVCADLR